MRLHTWFAFMLCVLAVNALGGNCGPASKWLSSIWHQLINTYCFWDCCNATQCGTMIAHVMAQRSAGCDSVVSDVMLTNSNNTCAGGGAGLMLVLLYGREGWFAPLIRATGFNIVFAFPGWFPAPCHNVHHTEPTVNLSCSCQYFPAD